MNSLMVSKGCTAVILAITLVFNVAYKSDAEATADTTSAIEVDILKIGFAQSLNADSAKTQADVYVSLLMPIPVNDKFVIITGVNYNNLTTKAFGNTIQSYKLTIPLGFKATLSEKNTITVVTLSRVTKLIYPNWNAKYQAGGIFLYTRTVSDRFKYNIGLYYNTEESGAFFIPVLGTRWKPSEKWEVRGNMPINLKILYTPVKPLKLGISYEGKYETYDLGNNYMVINRNEFTFFVETAIIKNLIIQAGIAYNLSNTSKVYSINDKVNVSIFGIHLDDSRTILANTTLNNSLFFDMKLIYRIFK